MSSSSAGRFTSATTPVRSRRSTPRRVDDNNDDPANPLDVPLVRHQFTNHLGSTQLETDENGDPISYEEYHPFGTSSYRSAKSGVDFSLKRYRFSGKERDDEIGPLLLRDALLRAVARTLEQHRSRRLRGRLQPVPGTARTTR